MFSADGYDWLESKKRQEDIITRLSRKLFHTMAHIHGKTVDLLPRLEGSRQSSNRNVSTSSVISLGILHGEI